MAEGDDDDERRLFEEAMRDVRRLKRNAEPPAVAKIAPPAVPRAVTPEAAEVAFETVVTGEHVSIVHPSLSPAARKALRRGETRPERTLDLHGLPSVDAARRVERLVAESVPSGVRCLQLITGRGLRSGPEGPVLRARVVDQLTVGPLRRHVLAVVSAPPHLGGTGALLVLLRKP